MLLGLRIIQGALGGAVHHWSFHDLPNITERSFGGDLSLFQGSMTAGQLLGPPVGAYAAAHMGYRSPFLLSFLLVGVCLFLMHIYVVDVPEKHPTRIRKSISTGACCGDGR